MNFFLFANGVYDSAVPTLQPNSTTTAYGSALGWEAGGGVTASHAFKGGAMYLSYKGDYRDYRSTGFNGGSDQSLFFSLQKHLNRRWSMTTSVQGGILVYGGSFYSALPSSANSVLANPFSVQTRFLSADISLTYKQTRRLSYVFSGSFFLNDYNYAGTISSRGTTGSVSVLYSTTSKTTFGGTYSHSYYTYGASGHTNIDGASLTLSHKFPDHWQLDLSAGASRTSTSGVITIPVSFLFGGQIVTGYYTGAYSRVNYLPSLQGTVTHYYRRSSISLTGGEGVTPGNGTFLTSRDQYVNGIYSYQTRKSNVSFGGGFYHLISISNTVTQDYTTGTFSASYGYNLIRYLSATLRYDFLHYGGLFVYSGLNESRVTFGITLSSKSLPMGLF